MKKYFSSRIFQKALAALTGSFLVLFLVGHLAGNLQLFIPGELGQKQFNAYALFMTTNPAVIALSYITYTSILLHLLFTFYLTLLSRRARPVNYLVESGSTNSTWSSRNMAFLGTMLLIFLIIHLKTIFSFICKATCSYFPITRSIFIFNFIIFSCKIWWTFSF